VSTYEITSLLFSYDKPNAQDWNKWRTVVNTVMKRRILSNAWNFLTSRGLVSVSGRTLLLI